MNDSHGRDQLVLIAGADLPRLTALFAAAPLALGAPLVVLLPPDAPLDGARELLATASPYPVLLSNDDPLAPNTLTLVDGSYRVALQDENAIVLKRTHERDIVATAASAAEALGDRVLAAIFAMPQPPAEAIALEVKRGGGMVLVVENDSLERRAALQAREALIDLVTTPEHAFASLRELVAAPNSQLAGDDVALRSFLEHVRSRTGIDFLQYKSPTIRRRLARLIAAAGVKSLPDYLRYLQSRPEAYARLIGSFLIKVTEFFRDESLFAYLRDEIVPEIIERAREENNEIRVWSAGCATGEEAYTIAIVIAEALGDELQYFNVRVFATDLDESAIAFARRGIYPRHAVEHLPPEILHKYFERGDGEYEVSKSIRALTVFGQHDLARRAPFPRIDVVLCRNVLIYFTKELQQRTLQMFAFSLREGGVLVLGRAETTSPAPEYYKPLHPAFKIYRRYGNRTLIPPPRRWEPSAQLERNPRLRRSGSEPLTLVRSQDERESSSARIGSALLESSLGIVLVDRRYDIVAINAAARKMLDIFRLGTGEDLIHLAGVSNSRTLRDVIDRALRGETLEATIEVEDATDGPRFLRIEAYPERIAEPDRLPAEVTMVFRDQTEAIVAERTMRSEAESARQAAREQALTVERLIERQRALIEANQQLTDANIHLRSANEQFLIAAEEAESSSEEIETLNEEMQATNEELETLNEELQATVEELNTTNDELQARSSELQRLAEAREFELERTEERERRLMMFLDGIPVALAMYSRDGMLATRNESFHDLLETYGDPLPLLTLDGTPFAPADAPLARAARGETVAGAAFLHASRTANRREVYVNARPIGESDGGGYVVTITFSAEPPEQDFTA